MDRLAGFMNFCLGKWVAAAGAVVTVVGFAACTSHTYNVAAERKRPVIAVPLKGAIVENGQSKILRRSGIVARAERGGDQVELTNLYTSPRCGLVFESFRRIAPLRPYREPEFKGATIVTTTGNRKTEALYHLQLEMRYSLWERLKFWHSDDGAVARALAWAYVRGPL